MALLAASIVELGIRCAKGPSAWFRQNTLNSFFFRGFDALKIFQKCLAWADTKHSRSAGTCMIMLLISKKYFRKYLTTFKIFEN